MCYRNDGFHVLQESHQPLPEDGSEGRRLATQGTKECFRVMKMFCILIVAVATGLPTFVKTQPIRHRKG